MSDLVERVARAIDPDAYIAAGFQGGDAAWGSAKARARAAIKAMREPTEAMATAANEAASNGTVNWRDYYGVLIDAALAESG